MNIGIVCYPTFGGSGVVATELGKALADQGHTIHFITYSRPIRLDLFSENIYYHQVNRGIDIDILIVHPNGQEFS